MGTFAGKYHIYASLYICNIFNILFILEVNCLLISKTIPIPQNDFFSFLGVGGAFFQTFYYETFQTYTKVEGEKHKSPRFMLFKN